MEKYTTTENNALKVLILEDSLPDMEFMVEQLSEAGYHLEVTHAENEAQFVEALEKNRYDIVLSDFNLPSYDAFEALEISQKLWPEVPFICVSGSIGEEKAIDLLKKGAVDYVLKDRPERLPFAIKNALAEAKEKADRIKTVRELQESENRFRQVAETANEWIWEIDTNGMYTYTSPVIELLLGYAPDEVVGKKYFYDFFIPEKREELKFAAFEVLAKRQNFNDFENSVQTKNGQLLIVSTNGSPIFDDNGNFKGYRGVDEDITKRKKAEEILEESYTLIKIAGEKAKLGGWNVNIGENRVYWSPEVASIHEKSSGYSPSVEEGINFYAPEWRSKIKKTFANCVGKGTSFDEEMQIITASGKRVWVRTIGEAVKDSSGKIVKVQGAFQDITERKISEEALLVKMDELERFHKLTVGREITMVALKKEVNNLLNKLGQDNKYKIVE